MHEYPRVRPPPHEVVGYIESLDGGDGAISGILYTHEHQCILDSWTIADVSSFGRIPTYALM
jgi:hypothetical protein